METPKNTNPQEKLSATFGAIFFITPHLMGIKTEFTTFYMKQNFPLFLVFIGGIIIKMLFWWIPFLGGLISMIITIFLVLVLIAIFLLAFHAYSGEKFEIPYTLKFTNDMISKVNFLKNFFTPKN